MKDCAKKILATRNIEIGVELGKNTNYHDRFRVIEALGLRFMVMIQIQVDRASNEP
jgi:hypothetical protein